MPYLVQYRYSYLSSGQTVQVTLYQKSSEGVGTPVITELVGGKPAFKVNGIDNDRDKFKPIRGKQATLIFKPQTGITASLFSSGADDEWIVEAVVVSTGFILFNGFLVMDDHEQSFLPVSHQYDIVLTATDNLGTLKEVPLTDDSGEYIRGYKKIIEVIAQCLRKTGLQLDIIVRDSWMEESQTTFGPACNVIYLQMKTFEKQINEAVSCYEALEIIFAYRLSVKQYNGTWWIENIDEKTSNDAYLFRFSYTGSYIGQEALATYVQSIGKAEEIKLINKDANLTYVRPYKYVKLNYRYEFPQEIVDNIDFSRGTFVSFNSGTLTATYTLSDWTLKAGTIGTPGTVTRTASLIKTYGDVNQTYEKSRYVKISSGSGAHWLESNAIPIEEKDKFAISIDFSLSSNITGSIEDGYGIGILLIASDGTKWIYGARPVVEDYKWQLYTGAAVDEARLIYTRVQRNDVDESQWITISGEVPPAPVSGDLYIRLLAQKNSNDTKYSPNLQFDYNPYINGDYSKYAGQSSTIEQSGSYKANVDDTVRIGDSPKKLFKGAMFKLVSSKYVLTENWFAGGDLLRQGLVPPYPPDDIYLHPFGNLQARAVWNQYNRRMIELSGSAKGLKLDSSVPDLIDTYSIVATTDAGTEVTAVKEFMLTAIEQDPENEVWNLSISETNDSVIGRDFTTPLTFKYETK